MAEKRREAQRGISRRTFLTSAAAGGVVIAASSMLAGCVSAETGGTNTAVAENAEGMTTYTLYETDVCIAGGGLAGMFAAMKAIEDGASVIILDKGPFGHSGTSGINWGHEAETNEWMTDDDGSGTLPVMVTINDGVVDQEYVTELCKAVHEARPNMRHAHYGAYAERVKGTNEVASGNANGPMAVDNGGFPRFFAQHVLRTGAKILDRVMVTDVLTTDDGAAAGVVAFDLVTGEPIVVRAKSTVLATGSYCWAHGWKYTGAVSIAGPENTGEGHSMFLKLGCEMIHMENLPASAYQQYPEGIAYGMGALGCGNANYQFSTNVNGERFNSYMDSVGCQTGMSNRFNLREIYEGRCTENGALYLTGVVDHIDEMNRYHRRVPENELLGLGYKMPDTIEVKMQFWEAASRPICDTDSMSAVDGLFFAGSADMSFSGCSWFGSVGTGWMAGRGAAKRAQNVDRPAVSWAMVNDCIATANNALAKDGSKRALDVYHSIQNVFEQNVSFIRNEEGLTAGIAELERIAAEDIPAMYVTNKTRRFNNEWRHAMEVEHMLNCTMGTAQAALARKETRGSHMRDDYPDYDNENFLKNIHVSFKDGTWSAEAQPLVTTAFDEEAIKTMIEPYAAVGLFSSPEV